MYKDIFLAYFDLMGFKEFILKNSPTHTASRMQNIYLDMESALTGNNFVRKPSGQYCPDVENAKLNCINISDTILYWTNDLDFNSLCKLFATSYLFNYNLNIHNFPARGCIIKGMVDSISGKHQSVNSTFYASLCLYGRGVVEAYSKAESQDWAGTVVDISITSWLETQQKQNLLNKYCVQYRVPYKKSSQCPTGDIGYDEYVLKLLESIPNDDVLKNTKESINSVFSNDNKTIDVNVQNKLNNTLKFADYLRQQS